MNQNGWTEQEAQKTLGEVMKRAATDPQFRQLALSNPEAAIGQITQHPLPPNYKVRFVENQGANMTVVLPDPISAEGELSDAELEQVAGGGRCGGSCLASCVISSLV